MVIVLLPPETKQRRRRRTAPEPGPAAHPELNPVRATLVDEVIALAADADECLAALGISAAQQAEIERNAALRASPTLPAVARYTGVLYDALDIESLTAAQSRRAHARLAVGSALFGLLRAEQTPFRLTGCRRRRNFPGDPVWPSAGDRSWNRFWPGSQSAN